MKKVAPIHLAKDLVASSKLNVLNETYLDEISSTTLMGRV